jgi:cell surface protein SprA
MTASIMEQFAPLINFDATLHNSLILKAEFKKDRNVSLSLANNQITEIKGNEFVIGTGYRFDDVKLPFKIGGKKVKSNLNTRVDISIRSNKTITRKIIENQNQVTAGQRLISIKCTADYKLGKALSVRAYFDRIVTKPFISTSFPTANTNSGLALRFTLQ